MYRDLDGAMADLARDPYADDWVEREPIDDAPTASEVEVLFIGGGFSALLTSARLREKGVESIRIVERGADVGGTWYWNRYPGVACDVVAYDYLPLLDEMDYVPTRHYAERRRRSSRTARSIATQVRPLRPRGVPDHGHLDDLGRRRPAVEHHDRSGRHDARQVRGLRQRHARQATPRPYRRHGDLPGPLVPHVALGLRVHGRRPREAERRPRRHHRHRGERGTDHPEPRQDRQERATSSSGHRRRSTSATTGRPRRSGRPSSKPDGRPSVAPRSSPSSASAGRATTDELRGGITREEKIRRQENNNIDQMMRIHQRIDETVEDPATADALKPWYMLMCKRPCFHNDYLPTFNRPNVHLVDTHGKGITEIGEHGPIFDGVEYEVDLLDLRHRIRGAEDRHLQPDRRRERRRPQRQVRRRHPHAARHPHRRLPEHVHHGRLPGVVPVQPDRPVAGAGRPHRQLHRARSGAWLRHDRRDAGVRGVVGAGSDRSPRQDDTQSGVHARATTTSKARRTAARTATTTAVSLPTSTTSPTSKPTWTPTSSSPQTDPTTPRPCRLIAGWGAAARGGVSVRVTIR